MAGHKCYRHLGQDNLPLAETFLKPGQGATGSAEQEIVGIVDAAAMFGRSLRDEKSVVAKIGVSGERFEENLDDAG